MDEQKKQLVEKLRSSTNILVTVRNNPNVDQLSACIGLTLMLNKMGKHASAVYSGETPSTIEFLQPEDTLEKNTNSLRDFIIALDKSKADKLRYKVEDKVVKIFITPYKTSISQDDLDFSQGDFNVDCVVALGAHDQGELDQAITEHGRILHDAVVMSINNANDGNLGSINWQDNSASSLSELVLELSKSLNEKGGKSLLDKQIATALLTGIVAETDRFSNEKTSAETMNASAELMEAGANQQLVATKLEEAMEIPASVDHGDGDNESNQNSGSEQKKSDDGTLEIDHEAAKQNAQDQNQDQPAEQQPTEKKETPAEQQSPKEPPKPNDIVTPDPNRPKEEEKLPEIKPLHPHESMLPIVKDVPSAEVSDITGVNFMAEQPSGSPNAANLSDDGMSPAIDPLSASHTPAIDHAMLNHNGPVGRDNDAPKPPEPVAEQPQSKPDVAQPKTEPMPEPKVPNPSFTPYTPPQPPQPQWAPKPPAAAEGQTLSDLEKSVHSQATPPQPSQQPEQAPPTDIDAARNEVLKALQESSQPPEPIVALGAQPLGDALHAQPETPADLQIDSNGDLHMPASTPAPFSAPVAPSLPPSPPGASSAPAPSTPQVGSTPPPLNPIGTESAPLPQSPADRPMDMPLPPSLNIPPPQAAPPTNRPGSAGTPPPPEPPPMLPPFPQR